MISCRILPHQVADGPENMALDEALLDAVANDPSCAIFRTYAWSVPTLSLGYFQPYALAEAESRWHDVPIVRRTSGGGALWHHHEVTYTLIVPKTDPLSRDSVDLYRAVHDAIIGVLKFNEVEARPRGGHRLQSRGLIKPFLCFADRDPEDVVSGHHKIVGSAQRRRAGTVLQHGSVLISQSSLTPELAGATDLGSIRGDLTDWSAQLTSAIPLALGYRSVESTVSVIEAQRARQFATEVYRNPSWTRKR